MKARGNFCDFIWVDVLDGWWRIGYMNVETWVGFLGISGTRIC